MKRAILTSYGHLASLGHHLIKLEDKLPNYDQLFEIGLRLYFNLNFN